MLTPKRVLATTVLTGAAPMIPDMQTEPERGVQCSTIVGQVAHEGKNAIAGSSGDCCLGGMIYYLGKEAEASHFPSLL